MSSQDIFLQAMSSDDSHQQQSQRGDVIKGRVVAKTDNGFLVDTGGKSEAVLPNSEIVGTVNVGDEIDVVGIRAKEGTAQVSQKEAVKSNSIVKIQESYENETPVKAKIERVIKNRESKPVGYGVSVDGVEAFLPFSHIRVPRDNEDELIGRECDVVVIKIDRDRVTVSERLIRDKLQQRYFDDFAAAHQPGDRLNATVDSVADSFALVNAENVNMFLHITEFDWKYVKNFRDVIKVGDNFEVIIDSIDPVKRSVRVSRKAAVENPMTAFFAQHKAGDNIYANVVRFAKGVAILENEDGVEFVLPVSEMSWVNKVSDPKQLLNIGDRVEVKVKEMDAERGRVVVSLRDLLENPWSSAETKYALNTTHHGKVTSITDFGIFVAFDDGLQGLIRKEDIEWNNNDVNLNDRFKKGDDVTAVVLNIDAPKERIRLGIKQLSENPMQNFADNHPVGSVVSGTVEKLLKDGIDVSLENGLTGFVHISQLSSENVDDTKNFCKEGDTVQAVVRRLNVPQQKIELSIKELAQAEEKDEIQKVLDAQKQDVPTLGSLLGDVFKKK